MFGKHFASMYSGSMFGKPALVFAVWGYVIAHMRPSRKDGQCYVELNPALLAATFHSTPAEVLEAIKVLCSPDPSSRSREADGRRLLPLVDEFVDGPMQFVAVNGAKYRAMRDEEERRTYLREAKRKERESTKTATVNRRQPPSSQAEAEAEAEGRKEGLPPLPPPPEQRAEEETRGAIHSLQLKLGSLLTALSEHNNSRRRVVDWCRECSSYEKADGTKVKGVSDYRTITSIDRLERSISDAEWWLEEMDGGRLVGPPELVKAAEARNGAR